LIEKDAAAARAELKVGDVITEIDGRAVLSDLRNRIGLMESGSGVPLTYLRQGHR
jgi:serine protease DegQ